MSILMIVGFGFFCFVLGYTASYLDVKRIIKLYKEANRIHEEIHKINNELIEKGN